MDWIPLQEHCGHPLTRGIAVDLGPLLGRNEGRRGGTGAARQTGAWTILQASQRTSAHDAPGWTKITNRELESWVAQQSYPAPVHPARRLLPPDASCRLHKPLQLSNCRARVRGECTAEVRLTMALALTGLNPRDAQVSSRGEPELVYMTGS